MIKRNVIHIRNLKQVLNHRLVMKKVHRVIKFNEKSCLRSFIDMNTELRKKGKIDLEKYFFKLMNNAIFGEAMKNVRNHRDIELIINKEKGII